MSDLPEGRRSRARTALLRGDVLIAYDEAITALEEHPDDLDARYVAALALARAGATERARDAAELLVAELDANAPISLHEDAEALVARIGKDEALAAAPDDQPQLLDRAARLYERVANRYGGYYALINAATLFLLSGDQPRAHLLAGRAREAVTSQTLDSAEEYWACATEAEAALVLGDVDAARDAIRRAAAIGATDVAARAVTRRQLRLVCDALHVDPSVLDPLAPPLVVHYCGHRKVGDEKQQFPDAVQREVRSAVQSFLRQRPIGFAYGSLASGADIVVAETFLDADIELNIVLPFAVEEFVAISVAPAGERWVERFDQCLSRATAVIVTSDSSYQGFDELFGYAGRIAMGHALNYASFLDAPAEQLAVWDGVASSGSAGTAHDVRAWARAGGPTHVISVPTVEGGRNSPSAAAPSTREIRAILFSDFRGFSRLLDEQFPAFLDHAFSRLADVLAHHQPGVLWCNTRGDGIAAVCTDVGTAASCALGFHESIAAIDFVAVGLPEDLTLRIGAHVGPVMTMRDPVLDEPAYWGRELTRAARIEPRTPEGEVYVTDAFAALLVLERETPFVAEYVGRMTTAKDFETIPMYRLRRRDPRSTS